ncbi:histidine phosphatase family protein [Bacillus sp. REN16]|uniref:histidine phosphatase family protein n=1 Tax=Bacillus sp. REN16 TaxID=2887296 RepID=UPI001E53C927|nr:histidine phosphatase family protein [Bacillus sp. REN16]MCC3355932.1 histidine phosphatase family protein [Bacillus sp. REN16]
MTKFFILRHGETEWNHNNNRYCGRTDISLSDIGVKQAQAAAKSLNGVLFDCIITSPLKRAKDTASIIKNELSFKNEITTDKRLVEIDFGKWEGLTKQKIENQYAESWTQWLKDPTLVNAGEIGETASSVYDRAISFYQDLSLKQPNSTILVVAHNTFNRFFITGTLGIPFNQYRKFIQSNTGISILEWNKKDEIQWHQLNAMMHLL